MDFHSLKRRDLQALCKKNNIPANITNAAMADALKSLETVEGVEEFLIQLENGGSESPERSVITSPNVPRTSTRQKPSKEGLECSKLATRTRCGIGRAVREGTDTRKTPATRTMRRKATQEAPIQQKTEKALQAKFEENLEQSQGSENKGVEPTETLEEVSGVSVDQAEVNNDGGDTVDADDDKENLGKDHVVDEVLEESTEMSNSGQKLDFHSLGRKDLQNLCKRNKIPANMTNAAMADALHSLDTIEGIEEFLKGYDPLAIKSPETSRMTSSQARQARTDRKTTGRKSTRGGSALCKSLAKKMEDVNTEEGGCPVSVNTDEAEQSVDENLQGHLDMPLCLKKCEFVDYVRDNYNSIEGESKSVSDISLGSWETGKEPQDETVETKSYGSDNQGIGSEMCDTTVEFETNLSMEPNVKLQDDASEKAGHNEEVEVNNFEESNIVEIARTDSDSSDDSNVDNDLMQEIAEAEIDEQECLEFGNKGGITEMLESDTSFSDEPDVKGLLQEAPALGTEGFGQSHELSDSKEVASGEGAERLLNANNSKQLGDFVNEVRTEEDSDVSEEISILVKDDMDPKPEEESDVATGNSNTLKVDILPKSAASCTIEDEYPKSGFVSNEEQEVSSSEISPESESENCQHELEKVVASISDAAASLCSIEKLEGDEMDYHLSRKFVPEPAAQASQPACKARETPLCHKSLRKLKRMLREKLQETNLLAKKMEKLTLDDDEIQVDNSGVDLDKQLKEDLGEGTKETEEMSDGLNSAPVSDNAPEDARDEESVNDLQMKATNVTQGSDSDVLSADEIDGSDCKLEKPFDVCAIEKHSNEHTALEQVERPEPDNITFLLQFTPSKSSRKTPSKSSSNTPLSAGRTICVLDANKENINDSATRTEAGKIKIAVASAMSMGKLKKEVKVLLQHSEKKRPALQSRSDNQCPLASP
ncbi:hypothetical protein Cgig2_023313 [Carnegiea gigantea]|uniref:Uncharacterized protein n=1 Tax=Carnegiea gigantea TaxID=171969 RepID=A0A9Q1JJK2_9CARY|nr:hypothetical protein Cgig2_023313 [Carnegiea gigantea]